MIRSFSLLLAAASVPAAFGGVDAGLTSLLPGSTRMVFNIDVQESRGSQFGRFLLRDVRWSDAKLEEVIGATGFDPRRDLVTLLFAAAPKSIVESAAASPGNGNVLVLARGSFDSAKIGAAALQHGWTRQSLSGTNIYLENGDQKPGHGFAFLDVDVAAMGDLNSIRQVIANRATSSQLNPDLDRLMKTASAGNDVWFASLGSPDHLAAAVSPGEGPQAGILRSISQSSGGIKFGSTVQFSFDALTKTAKDATSLADVVRFLASAAQMKRDQDPNAAFLAPALDNLNLASKENSVHVTTSLPEDSLEAFAAQMHSGGGRAHLRGN